MRKVPDAYKRVARMSGAELCEHLDMPTWAPGGPGPRATIRMLVVAEIRERLVNEIPRVRRKRR